MANPYAGDTQDTAGVYRNAQGQAVLPPGIGTDAEVNQANTYDREQPWYQQFLQQHDQGSGPVKLSDKDREQLMNLIRSKGVEFSNHFEIDQSGNIHPISSFGGDVLKAVAIGGLALTGLGLAGVGPLAGVFAGAGAGAGVGSTVATGALHGAELGAITGGASSALRGQGFKGILKGAGMGALTGGATGGVGAALPGGGGFAGALGRGAVRGAVGAGINRQNPLLGAATGVATGAIGHELSGRDIENTLLRQSLGGAAGSAIRGHNPFRGAQRGATSGVEQSLLNRGGF